MFYYTISIIILFYIGIEKTEGYFLLDSNAKNMLSADIKATTEGDLDNKILSVHDLSARNYLQKLMFKKPVTKDPSSTVEMKGVSSSSTTPGSTVDPSSITKANYEINTNRFDLGDLANVESYSDSDRQTFTGTLSHLSATDEAQNKMFLSSSVKLLSPNWKNPSTLNEIVYSRATTNSDSKVSRMKLMKKRYGVSTKVVTNLDNEVTESVVSSTPPTTFKRPSTAATTVITKPIPDYRWQLYVPIKSCGGFIGTAAPPKLDSSNQATKEQRQTETTTVI